MSTANERLELALAMYNAMPPEQREQLMELMREMVKAQEAGMDADARAAMPGDCEQAAG